MLINNIFNWKENIQIPLFFILKHYHQLIWWNVPALFFARDSSGILYEIAPDLLKNIFIFQKRSREIISLKWNIDHVSLWTPDIKHGARQN
jgi:hypothetical protein